MSVEVLTDSRVVLRGQSNLPDDTQLAGSVSNKRLGFMGQSSGVIENGRFELGPFGPVGGLKEGRYEAAVTMPYAYVQSESVREVIGSNGEALKGKLVRKGPFGRTVEIAQTFDIGTASAAGEKRLDAGARREALRIDAEIAALLEEGRALQSLRERPRTDLQASAACGSRMRALQPRAETLRRAASRLPLPYKFTLESAAGALTMCVSCSSGANDQCDQVAEFLAEAEKDLSERRH